MGKILFRPWVGAFYRGGIQGKKVLVLGESHYCANASDAYADMTIDIIKDLMAPSSEFEEYKNTYTKFAEAISGRKLSWNSFSELERIWNSIAFYNFVQEPISGARVSPTTAQFRDSDEAFFQVLENLRPDVVIAWGTRLYNNLPQKGTQGPDTPTPDGNGVETWTYTISGGHVVKVLPITHPSAGFSPEYWNSVIEAFLGSK